MLKVHKDSQGRFLFLFKGKLDFKITFAAVYAPNDGQIDFLRQTFLSLQTFAEGPLVVVYVANLDMDRTHSRASRNKNNVGTSLFTPLQALLEAFQMVDVWRREHPQDRDYTYFSPRHNIHTRIDFILISKPRVEMIVSAQIGPKNLTDNSWINGVFKRSIDFQCFFSWSLNKSLCSAEFCSKITKEIQTYFEENNNLDLQEAVIWDMSKATLRGSFISQVSYKKKETTLMRNQLLLDIGNLEKLHKQSGNPKIFRQLEAARKSFDNLELP